MLKKLVLIGCSLLSSFAAHAADELFPDEMPPLWTSVVSVSGGMGWGTAGQDQWLYPFELPQYQYYTYNSKTSTMGTAEVLFSLQRVIYPNLVGQFGLGGGWMSDATVSGDVTVNGYPEAYSYTYKVNHGRIEFKGKLIAYTFKPLQPYISASLGVAFNDAHDYQPVWLNPAVTSPLNYVSKVAVAFPYTFGAGVQANLSANWQLGVGYQFADLGKSFLAGDPNQENSSGLRLTHFYTNAAMITIGYVFS